MKARQSHPDRHPDDPEAHSKFQKIGEAYQILSDPKLRANYDAAGRDGVEGVPKLDSATLFAMIFGSEKFEPIVGCSYTVLLQNYGRLRVNYVIGELKVASAMQATENGAETTPFANKLQLFKQKKREIQCALNLVQKIQPYVDSNGDQNSFAELLMNEVKELSASPFGSTLVTTIGNKLHAFTHQLTNLLTLSQVNAM